MLLFLAIILVVAWIGGFAVFHVAGWLIHLLLIFAIASFIFHLITGRSSIR
ncbi:lmo0937 family membrane protein [Novosphingobium humi]|uniref:Lmo0937 family membrane protein n=1 Tax=Novosphingobium humi TaxID=2282397 RepID=A0ABY7TWS2_9SPHN|nr:lmo0937 family membrane protein [Novosphingobium humi]WCT77067.1 lmo0937 family membrane protein [Novosphingobium humi]